MKAKIGDKITISDNLCKSCQLDYESANRKGIVLSISPIGSNNQYCKIRWEDGMVSGSLSSNLKKQKNLI